MSHQQSSRGQQPQQQPQEAALTMDQILQYLAQHTMAIEQLLSRGQTQGEAAKPTLFDGERENVMNRQIPLSQYLYFFSFSFLLIM